MSIEWKPCKCGVKRDFMTKRNAEKNLGRARAKRTRRADAHGSRRGLKMEGRVYQCPEGGWHLTSESRSSYANRVRA